MIEDKIKKAIDEAIKENPNVGIVCTIVNDNAASLFTNGIKKELATAWYELIHDKSGSGTILMELITNIAVNIVLQDSPYKDRFLDIMSNTMEKYEDYIKRHQIINFNPQGDA